MSRIWADPQDGKKWDVSRRMGRGESYPDLVIFVSEDRQTWIVRADLEKPPAKLSDEELCRLLDRARTSRT